MAAPVAEMQSSGDSCRKTSPTLKKMTNERLKRSAELLNSEAKGAKTKEKDSGGFEKEPETF